MLPARPLSHDLTHRPIVRTALMLAAIGGCLGCSPARAQSVDYGASELLFGEPVTASVTGKPQRATDAPANVEIITQDDIRRSGATSIPEVLQFVPGVDVRMSSPENADVGVRGYNQTANPHLMVLVNGRQVYMVDYGRIIWSAIPVQLDEIRQIEVIKGPNSALYGFNAVGGVINIITYDPLRDSVNVGTARVGTGGYLMGSVVGTGHIGDSAGVRLSLGGFRANDFPPGPLSAEDRQARENPFTGTFNADARWQISPTIELFGDASLGDTRYPNETPPGEFQTETMVHNSVRAGISADTAWGLLRLAAYRSDARVQLTEITDLTPLNTSPQQVVLGEYQSTYVVEASDLAKIGANHTVRLGLEYRRNADDSGTIAMGSISNDIYSASLMWDWQVSPAVSLTNAVRVDHLQLHYSGTLLPASGLTVGQYNRSGMTEPSFNSGLVWKATDDDTFRISLARGVQLPTLLEYALQVPAGFGGLPITFAGRPDLTPTIMWNAELDYDRDLAAIGSVLRTAAFAQRLDDIISWPFGAPFTISPTGAPIFYSRNVGYSTAEGLEIAIKGHAESGLHWNASYSLVSTTDHTALGQGPVLTGTVRYVHAVPSHVVVAGIGWTHDRLELDMQARWQSSFVDYRIDPTRTFVISDSVDNYLTVFARAGYRLTDQVTLSAIAQQLDAPTLKVSAGPLQERRFILGITVHM
jgi:iron complex outermembrane receptor protein